MSRGATLNLSLALLCLVALIGACLLGGGIINFALIPHPTWMVIIGVLIFIPSALLGATLSTRQARKNASGLSTDSG